MCMSMPSYLCMCMCRLRGAGIGMCMPSCACSCAGCAARTGAPTRTRRVRPRTASSTHGRASMAGGRERPRYSSSEDGQQATFGSKMSNSTEGLGRGAHPMGRDGASDHLRRWGGRSQLTGGRRGRQAAKSVTERPEERRLQGCRPSKLRARDARSTL